MSSREERRSWWSLSGDKESAFRRRFQSTALSVMTPNRNLAKGAKAAYGRTRFSLGSLDRYLSTARGTETARVVVAQLLQSGFPAVSVARGQTNREVAGCPREHGIPTGCPPFNPDYLDNFSTRPGDGRLNKLGQ